MRTGFPCPCAVCWSLQIQLFRSSSQFYSFSLNWKIISSCFWNVVIFRIINMRMVNVYVSNLFFQIFEFFSEKWQVWIYRTASTFLMITMVILILFEIGFIFFCYLQVTKQIFSVFPTTTKMQLEMFLFLMVREIVKMQCVSYNYDLGMIQDRIEKLGRDVFYDMLSCGREPLHALCVLKVYTRFYLVHHCRFSSRSLLLVCLDTIL